MPWWWRATAGTGWRRSATAPVAHALTMASCTAWDEGLSYTDPRDSGHAMELAAG